MQLCVCLANLAIQMTEWKNVLPLILSTLGTDSQTLPCVLDFLRVLPEEVTEGRKINLTVRSAETSSTYGRLPAVPRIQIRIRV
jgi:transportin-3